MKYGLSEKQLSDIIVKISEYSEIDEAVLFGSRAIDTFKEASDVDIALKGEKVNAALAAKLKFVFEEDTYLPFFFDFVAYPTITNEKLKVHIEKKGVVIYRKGERNNEWKECTLADVAEKFAMGPFGSNIKAENFSNSGVPVIRGTNLNFYKYVGGDFVCLTEDKANQLKSSNCFPGDLVFTHRGTIGQVGLIPKGKYPRYVILQSGMKVTVNPNLIDNNYLFYFFKSDRGQHELLQHESQVGVPSISNPLTSLKSVSLLLPPLPEQHAIATVLSSLDDKIDLLHRQNKTLEAMAETLFRQWFVEPFDSALGGKADEGWVQGKMPDEFDYVMGSSPPGESYNEIGVGIPMFQGNADFGFRFPQKRVFTTTPIRFAQKFDTLISVRAPVGSSKERCCIGRGVAAFRYKALNDYYTYTYYKMKSLMGEIERFNDTGTVFGSISKSDFEAFDITIPAIDVVNKFQAVAKPLDDKVISNTYQLRSLEKLRDTLLPKLMSGEVRVSV
jgi:type I restriction enzyme S subunit